MDEYPIIDLSHLLPAAQGLARLPADERIQRLRADRWIGYPRAVEALNRLEALYAWPNKQRMPNLLLVGPTNNGKSMIVEKFRRTHPASSDADQEHIPVLVVQMPSEPSVIRFYVALLAAMGAPLRELNATERNYALYVDSLEKSRIDRELDKSQISNISVIEEATYNPGRIFPKTLLMLFLAVPFGLAVGLLVVYLCYLLDQRIHDGGLVEEKFGLPLWTTLPELSNSTAESSNAFTASIYRLYGLLPYARIEEKGLTLGLTSARHGEGVTFIIEQLRRLLEENGVRVRIGGEPAQPGEVVLLDAPALLDSREAFIALRRADLIALVVEAQKSTVPVVEHALTILTTAFGKVDGIIINRRRFEVPSKVLQTIARYRSAF
ncbi:TniB family NTP-binding protein [Pseudomonas aeruginosa]|uniref:TniB family NTP-binding protein n=1 Tax=Pseudomonas aeruginosa TaxID=287 RepID=UPI003014CA59